MTGFPIIVVPFTTMKVTFPVGLTFPLVTLAVSVTDWDALPLYVAVVLEATIVVPPRRVAAERGGLKDTVGPIA